MTNQAHKYSAQDEAQVQLRKLAEFIRKEVSCANLIQSIVVDGNKGNLVTITVFSWPDDWQIDKVEVFDYSYDKVVVFRDVGGVLTLKGYLSRDKAIQHMSIRKVDDDDGKGEVLSAT